MNEDVKNITRSAEGEAKKIRELLQEVMDPEVPVLSVLDLGIVRDVSYSFNNGDGEGEAVIVITPTYSGCPAMSIISMNIKFKLLEHGYKNITVNQVLSPAWTTDWMTETGKEKLKAYGIAAPNVKQQVCDTKLFHEEEAIQCPRCNSYRTRRISEFGSTACKALYQCNECLEPFDYFKCH